MKKVSVAVIIPTVLLLAATWVSAGVYTCKCKGVKKRTLIVFTENTGCGYGYETGAPGDVRKVVPDGQLRDYVPQEKLHELKTEDCTYSSDSGWACGKVTGLELPACVDD